MMIIRIVDCNEKNLINAHAIDARWLDLFHFSLVKFLCVLPASVWGCLYVNDKVSNFLYSKNCDADTEDIE